MDKETLRLFGEVAEEFLNNALDFRYDICTCAKCRHDMLDVVVENLGSLALPRAVSTAQEVKDVYQKDVSRAIMHAIEYIGNKPKHEIIENINREFKRLLHKISSERGLDLRNYHTELLKRRIALRLQKNAIRSYAEYISFLNRKPAEYDRLFETLCINVSEFFRDPPVWVTIRYLFETLIRIKIKNPEHAIKVWSVGCACGEEAYSLAIMLKEASKITGQAFRTAITATDVDKACLAAAQKGRYNKDSLKNVNHQLLTRYFELSEGDFLVKEEIKRMVDFEYLDLTSQNYLVNKDVIVCRNVFIYFNRDLQKEILMKFHRSLRPGGYLIMGKSESLFPEQINIFETIDVNARIFRKIAEPSSFDRFSNHNT